MSHFYTLSGIERYTCTGFVGVKYYTILFCELSKMVKKIGKSLSEILKNFDFTIKRTDRKFVVYILYVFRATVRRDFFIG